MRRTTFTTSKQHITCARAGLRYRIYKSKSAQSQQILEATDSAPSPETSSDTYAILGKLGLERDNEEPAAKGSQW